MILVVSSSIECCVSLVSKPNKFSMVFVGLISFFSASNFLKLSSVSSVVIIPALSVGIIISSSSCSGSLSSSLGKYFSNSSWISLEGVKVLTASCNICCSLCFATLYSILSKYPLRLVRS